MTSPSVSECVSIVSIREPNDSRLIVEYQVGQKPPFIDNAITC